MMTKVECFCGKILYVDFQGLCPSCGRTRLSMKPTTKEFSSTDERNKMKKVVIESPLSGNFTRNIRYARLCALDCIRRGEAPYASHLMMTQFLDDCVPEERKTGMEVGFEWAKAGEVIVVYQDLGISAGMYMGIENAVSRGQKLEYRNLSKDLMDRIDDGVPTKTEGIENEKENLDL